MKITTIASFAAILALSACALTEEQCQRGNWVGIGQNDGKNGRDADFVDQHVKACGKHGVTVDIAEWERGRELGLKAYCTPREAYERSARGFRYNLAVCPAETQPDLIKPMQQGEKYYDITERINDLQRERSALTDELASLGTTPADGARRFSIQNDISLIDFRIRALINDRSRYSVY